jgi:hypothetical protein
MNTLQSLRPDDLVSNGLQVIIERHYMIAVPAHAAADVKQQLIEIDQHG